MIPEPATEGGQRREHLQRDPWLRALIILGVLIASIYLFGQVWAIGARFADTIVVLFLAWMIAFLLSPFVRFMMAWRHMPRLAAVISVYLILIAVVAGFGVIVVPPTVQQAADLGNEIPEWADRIPGTIDDVQAWLDRRGIEFNIREFYEGDEVQARAQEFGQQLAERSVSVAQEALFLLLYLAIILIIGFYFLLDGPNILAGLVRLTPPNLRADLDYLLVTTDRSFGGYLRSWAILGVIYAAGTAIVMAATGIPFILPVAVFAGFMLIIPFIGDIIAVIPAIVIGALTVSVEKVIIAVVALILLQQMVLHVLRPKIMGDRVGMHPILVLVAFLVGARAAGIWGAFFSVPIAAIVQSVGGLYYHRYVLARSPVESADPAAYPIDGVPANDPGTESEAPSRSGSSNT